jgi:hypothetical protein
MAASQADESAWFCTRFEQRGDAVFQRGRHCRGTYLRVHMPLGGVYSPQPVPLLYLHDFALCLPEFYEQHLTRLVGGGHGVFFPDFQRSLDPDTRSDAAMPPRQPQAA